MNKFKMLSKPILPAFIALAFYACTDADHTQMVNIMDVTRDTTIVIKDNNSLFEQWVQIDVSGNIDGEAAIEVSRVIINENRPKQIFTTVYNLSKRLPKFYIKEEFATQHTIHYKSKSAKKGSLTMMIKLPGDPNLLDSRVDYHHY